MTTHADPTDHHPNPAPPTEAATMLLSRVAENIYWAGRYLERAEATARLVRTHTGLFIDLPRSAGLGWTPLLAVTGSAEIYEEAHVGTSEDDIVSFLLADPTHTGSVVSSVSRAREALRATRVLVPRRSWEIVNEMHLWTKDSCAGGVDRRARIGWTEAVIRWCNLLSGSLLATMTRDDAYSFLEIGRFIERADMTTRVLDVQAGILMADEARDLHPYSDLTWLAVLRSLGAEQMFRRANGGLVSGADAVRFLLRDPAFPRSVEHCLIEVSRWLLELPNHERPMAGCAQVQCRLDEVDESDLTADSLHAAVDELQVGLGSLHDSVHDTFLTVPSLAEAS